MKANLPKTTPSGRARRIAPGPLLLARLTILLALAAPAAGHAAAAPSIATLKKLSFEELMDMEVTSVSRRSEKLSEAAAAIQVITAEDIHRSGATSLPEALRLAGNLDVARRNSHDWGISARGFNTELANKLLVLMDGRTLYTPLFSGVSWGVQDTLLEDIDRIEVISGPGGSLWGANAVNGVINIITKSARDTQGLYVESGGGEDLRGFAGARYGGVLAPDIHFRVYGKYFDRGTQATAAGGSALDSWQMNRGGFRLDAGAGENTLTLQGDIYDGDQHMQAGGTSRVSGGNLLGRWTRTMANDSDFSLQLYYDRAHQANPVAAGPFSVAGVFTDDLDTYDLDFQHRFHLGGRNQVVWGLGYRTTIDDSQKAPGLAFVPAYLKQELSSGFVQDEIALRPGLSLTFGTKVEHNDYTGLELEPSSRLQWNATDNHLFWGAVSRPVRTPSRVDRDIRQPNPPPAILIGGANFDSEKLTAYELGYRGQLRPDLSLSLSTFYNEYDDLRSLGFNPVTIVPFVFENNLEGETYGFELTTTWQVREGWRLRANYNLLKEHLRAKPGTRDINNARNETADPTQQVSLHSAFDLTSRLTADLDVRWVDVLHANSGGALVTVPSYFGLDARVGWQLSQGVEISVVGQNLLDAQHPEYGAPGPGRVEIQRAVHAKVSWRF